MNTRKTPFFFLIICFLSFFILFLRIGTDSCFAKEWPSQTQINGDSSRTEYVRVITDSQDNIHIFWTKGRNDNDLCGGYWYAVFFNSKLASHDIVLVIHALFIWAF